VGWGRQELRLHHDGGTLLYQLHRRTITGRSGDRLTLPASSSRPAHQFMPGRTTSCIATPHPHPADAASGAQVRLRKHHLISSHYTRHFLHEERDYSWKTVDGHLECFAYSRSPEGEVVRTLIARYVRTTPGADATQGKLEVFPGGLHMQALLVATCHSMARLLPRNNFLDGLSAALAVLSILAAAGGSGTHRRGRRRPHRPGRSSHAFRSHPKRTGGKRRGGRRGGRR
jgi:hypothetical protein